MRTAIYLRVSTEDQHPENQLKSCLELCRIRNLENPHILEEHGSAWKDNNRPVFESLLEKARKGELKSLVVWDYDRLYRNRKRAIQFFRDYSRLGLKIYSVRQSWMEELERIPEPFDEIMRDLMLQVVSWMAEDESKKKSERVRLAYENRSRKWGRKRHRVSRKFVRNLRKTYPDASLRELARKVREETGHRISHQTIAVLLREAES